MKKRQPKPNNQRRAVVSIALVACLAAGLYCWLNRGYGEVSDHGFDIAMTLMSVCNRQDEPRLHSVIELIEQSAAKKELPPQDASALLGIANKAKNGNWASANSSIRRLLDDQVNSQLALNSIHDE
jgi:hypothetical protein